MWDKGARRGARWTDYVVVHLRVHTHIYIYIWRLSAPVPQPDGLTRVIDAHGAAPGRLYACVSSCASGKARRWRVRERRFSLACMYVCMYLPI